MAIRVSCLPFLVFLSHSLFPPLFTYGQACFGASSAAVPAQLAGIDLVVERALARQDIPGAVVAVGTPDCVLFEKAYGNRSLLPTVEPMTVDTIFDLASLTKVLATAPSIMILDKQRRLKLDDPVAKYLPAFGRRGKGKITIRHLLIHYSGLPADLTLRKKSRLKGKALLEKIYQSKPLAPPGQRFIYSDLGFIVLGKVVEQITGKTLDRFAYEQIFSPLHMETTCFVPDRSRQSLIAPTEKRGDGSLMRGQVHDPLAARLGGVAGHAGLFSTASDLVKFCQMFLSGGAFEHKRILDGNLVMAMVSPQSPPQRLAVRGFGWDIQTDYSSSKGAFFSSRSYGHTGFTGTSIWIDPEIPAFLIILTNRVHPNGRGNVKDLRAEIADIVGVALRAPGEHVVPADIRVSAGSFQ